MKSYRFFDTDANGTADYDITGAQYRRLLDVCFQYCTTFSVIIMPGCFTQSISDWEIYRIPVTPSVQLAYRHYGKPSAEALSKVGSYEIFHYRLTPSMKQMISKQTNSLFSWVSGWGYNNPSDPVFYREDGSIFFSSLIHEGECTLSPIESEDVSQIISDGLWTAV